MHEPLGGKLAYGRGRLALILIILELELLKEMILFPMFMEKEKLHLEDQED